MKNKPSTRMCVACRARENKANFYKFVKVDNNIVLDTEHKLDGRSAYLCKNSACIEVARKRKSLERAFSCKIEMQILEMIEAY